MARIMTLGLIVYFLVLVAAAWVAPDRITHQPTGIALGE